MIVICIPKVDVNIALLRIVQI